MRVPAHRLALGGEDPEQWHGQAREARHRPGGAPGAEAAGPERGVDLPAPAIRVLARPAGREVAQPVERQARVHALPATGEPVEAVRPAHLRARLLAMLEPARELACEQPRALVV